MSESHNHPGQREPRSYGRTHHENAVVNLNAASEKEIAELPMVGPERAQAILKARPFQSWEDVERIPGLSAGMVDDLKSGGAQLEALPGEAKVTR